MLLLVVTGCVVLAWLLFVGARTGAALSTRLVLAGLGASGQIVVVCTALLATGALTWPLAVSASLAIAVLLAAVSVRSLGGASGLRRLITRDLARARCAARAALGWETVLLAVMVAFAALWLWTAAYFYPPGGAEDLAQRLPAVYQSVQVRKFQILPLALRPHFALPFAGEMPSVWVALLTGSTRWVDGAQGAFVPLAMAALFVLARRFGASPRAAAFASALFSLMPVVLREAASNDVDLMLNVWVLLAAVAVLQHEESRCRTTLALSGLAMGVLIGTQPLGMLFALPLGLVSVRSLWSRKDSLRARAVAAGFLGVPALGAGSYWYVRNAIRFANPFFPYRVTVLGRTILDGPLASQGASVWSRLLAVPAGVFRIALWDPGLGAHNGGYGFLFWGFGAPALAYMTWSVLRERGRPLEPIAVIALVPLGLALVLASPHADIAALTSAALVLAVLALIAVARLVDELAHLRIGAASALRAAGVAGAFLALLPSAHSDLPLMNLSFVVREMRAQRALGESHYLRHASPELAINAGCWAALDAISRDDAGLTVYQAAPYQVFWTAPTFGSRLQNRIWNFESSPESEPEAYFFQSAAEAPLYIGKEIHREMVAADPRYQLVAASDNEATTLYVSRAALAQKGRKARLVDYYRLLSPRLVALTAASAALLEPGCVALVPFPLAGAYMVHEADGRPGAVIEPIANKDLETVAARFPERVLYTFGRALPGRRSTVVLELSGLGKELPLVRNEPVPGAAGASGATGVTGVTAVTGVTGMDVAGGTGVAGATRAGMTGASSATGVPDGAGATRSRSVIGARWVTAAAGATRAAGVIVVGRGGVRP